MKELSIKTELESNSYPGRGIIAGLSEDGKYAVSAYWTMGRSAGSRNRIFVEEGEGIKTQAFDSSLIAGDPSLIIYSAVKVLGKKTIVTNGDQTDTIYDYLKDGKTVFEALQSREFEPDEPNYTPRISGVLEKNGDYMLSILKSNNGKPQCVRNYFEYPAEAGLGHFIHTYKCDGNPIPSYEGEPTLVEIGNESIDDFTKSVWDNLNEDNKVSLFTRYINLETGEEQTRIVNKNE